MPRDFVVSTDAFRPTTTGDLEAGERLILRAFRRWVAGLRDNRGQQWSLVWNSFAKELGTEDGQMAVSGLAGLINGLLEHARRPLRHHHPCCPCLNGDEVSVIRFVAACQGGPYSLARGLAEWLVEPDGVGDMLAAGARLGAALGRHFPRLPLRTGAAA